MASPVCRWGGRDCAAGPGAVGSIEEVDQHEREFHGKKGGTTKASKETRRRASTNLFRALQHQKRERNQADIYSHIATLDAIARRR